MDRSKIEQTLSEVRARRRARALLLYGEPRLDDDGRWVTTKSGAHVHIGENGEPDKGNPHVLEKMSGGSKSGSGKKARGSFAPKREEMVSKATKAKSTEISKAIALLKKSEMSKEDYDNAKRALSFLKAGNKGVVSEISDEALSAVNHAVERAQALEKSLDNEFKARDIDSKIENLHKSAYKAEHYGKGESGGETSSYEKQIKELEKKRDELLKESKELMDVYYDK